MCKDCYRKRQIQKIVDCIISTKIEICHEDGEKLHRQLSYISPEDLFREFNI